MKIYKMVLSVPLFVVQEVGFPPVCCAEGYLSFCDWCLTLAVLLCDWCLTLAVLLCVVQEVSYSSVCGLLRRWRLALLLVGQEVICVPHSKSGIVPRSSLSGAGSWGSERLGRVGQLGEGWGK